MGAGVGSPLQTKRPERLLSEYLQVNHDSSCSTEAKRDSSWLLYATSLPAPFFEAAGDTWPQREGVSTLTSGELSTPRLQISAHSSRLSGSVLPGALSLPWSLPDRNKSSCSYYSDHWFYSMSVRFTSSLVTLVWIWIQQNSVQQIKKTKILFALEQLSLDQFLRWILATVQWSLRCNDSLVKSVIWLKILRRCACSFFIWSDDADAHVRRSKKF